METPEKLCDKFKQTPLQSAHRETGKLLEHKHDPFNYHKTLRKLIGQQKQKSIPPLETTDGEMLTDELQKANLLNDYFASQTELTEIPTLPDTVSVSFYPVYV